MKKFIKFIFILLIIVGIGFGVYFLFFNKLKKEDVYLKVDSLYGTSINQNVNIVDSAITKMPVDLQNYGSLPRDQESLSKINMYIENNIYFNKIFEFTYNNILFAEKVDNYKKDVKNSYKSLMKNYEECEEYLTSYYLPIKNKDSAITEADKGALVNYINNFVVLYDKVNNYKKEFCRAICLAQFNAYNNQLKNSPLNGIYLELTGTVINYLGETTVTENEIEYLVDNTKIQNLINNIFISSNKYFNDTEKYSDLRSIMDNIDYKSLVKAYVFGNLESYINSLIDDYPEEQRTDEIIKIYNQLLQFANEFLV